jgi:hypothetical protein
VFLISDGKTYEMAEKAWSGTSSDDTPTLAWCSNTSTSIPGTFGLLVGTGGANTDLMLAGTPAACTSGAGVSARTYLGGGFTDWFLPSKDELNAMYLYSKVAGFDTATYGFYGDGYWSSSQIDASRAGGQLFGTGDVGNVLKSQPLRVRPIRSF